MTKLLTIPESWEIPSVPVGSRRRIDVRWVEQWLAAGGYRLMNEMAAAENDHAELHGRK